MNVVSFQNFTKKFDLAQKIYQKYPMDTEKLGEIFRALSPFYRDPEIVNRFSDFVQFYEQLKQRVILPRECRVVQDPTLIHQKLLKQKNIVENFRRGMCEEALENPGKYKFSYKNADERKEKITVLHQELQKEEENIRILEEEGSLLHNEDDLYMLEKRLQISKKVINSLRQEIERLSPSSEKIDGRDFTAGIALLQNGKKLQQDACLVDVFEIEAPSGVKHRIMLSGVFDGNGEDPVTSAREPVEMSNYLKEHLSNKIQSLLCGVWSCTLPEGSPLKVLEGEKFLSDVLLWNVLKLACVELEEEFSKSGGSSFKGSTASFSLLVDDRDLWHANIGDSRSFLHVDGETVPLSEDMVLTKTFSSGLSHRQFLEKVVFRRGQESFYEKGVWKRGGFVGLGRDGSSIRLNGVLEPARCVGAKIVGDGLSARSKIVKYSLPEEFPFANKVFIVHATDGLWDVCREEQISQVLQTQNGRCLKEIAEDIVCSASSYSKDNIAVALVKLDMKEKRETAVF